MNKIQYDNQPVYIKYTIDSNGEGSIVKEIKELYNEAFNLVGISRKNYKYFFRIYESHAGTAI